MRAQGVCWRGPRIFEGPASKAVVTKWIAFYRKYRPTLTSEMLVHVRRPDGQNVDVILHANSAADAAEQGLLFAFNPTDKAITANVSVSLYYTGLESTATVTAGSVDELDTASSAMGAPQVHTLRRDYSIVIEMAIPANGYEWWVIHGK